MARRENAKFLRDPNRYMANNALNMQHFLSFPKATVAPEEMRKKTWLLNNSKTIQGTDDTGKLVRAGWDLIALDFVKRTARTAEGDRITFVVARLARDAFGLDRDPRPARGDLNSFHDTPNPIWGYYFPYVDPPGGGAEHRNWDPCEDFGHVDFPRDNPQFPFVFTGGFSGCAIVITLSPRGDNYYRAYHYPNPDTYNHWKNIGRWKYQVIHWFGFEQYGGELEVDEYGRPLESSASIFLFHDGRKWWICSQLHHLRKAPADRGPATCQLKITEISRERRYRPALLQHVPPLPRKRPPPKVRPRRMAPPRPSREPTLERKGTPLPRSPSRKD